MSHFTQDFITFFKELEENNSKAWFDENRKRYEKNVKKTFYTFLDDTIEAISKIDPEINISAKEAVFRINRDIRFSKDKTPYKIHMAAVISRSGRKNLQTPGIYIQCSANDVYIGGGSHSPSKDELYNIRNFLLDNYDQMIARSEDKEFKKLFDELKGDKNKVLPTVFKEFAQDHPFMFNKQFYYMKQYSAKEILLKDDFVDFVVKHYLTGKAFNDFLNIARQSR